MILLPSDDEMPDTFRSSTTRKILESEESDIEQDDTWQQEKLHSSESSKDSSVNLDTTFQNKQDLEQTHNNQEQLTTSISDSDKSGDENKNVPVAVEEDSDGSSEESDSSDESDGETPPIRIFRNKEAASQHSNQVDHEWSDDEEIIQTSRTQRKPRLHVLPDMEIKSETQRLIRESAVNLPYFVPERKKLSDFLQRPSVFTEPQEKDSAVEKQSDNLQCITAASKEKVDDRVDVHESLCPSNINTQNCLQSKKEKLLKSMGIKLPKLCSISKAGNDSKNKSEFISLNGDTEEATEATGVSKLMQRFMNHSKARVASKARRVQFTVVQKEERADGTGCELVNNVIVATEPSENLSRDGAEPLISSCGGDYRKLKDKLNAKMKQRRMQERLKKEAMHRLDNEEIDESEEELSDNWSENESSDEENNCETRESRIPVIDDNESEESNSRPSFQNTSPIGKNETSLPQFTREGSLLLFDDSVKRLNCSRDEPSEHSFENMYSSMIPPNQPELSDISDCSKPKINLDEDSIFGVTHSPNTSVSQSRGDGESQFIDSDGFIKEAKSEKSLNFLPPGAEDDNANDCNMSQLLELCSGKFQESTRSEHLETSNGNESFGFQVNAETAPIFSDEEKNEESDDEEITIIRRKKTVNQAMMKDFLEEEAELSGSDVGSDDEDDEINDFYEEEENDEVLPQEDVIHDQVNKVHLKQLMDEDQRHIDLLQEAFVEDNVELRRKRKFHWKNIDSSINEEMFSSGDENDEAEVKDDNEESSWRKMRLEREEYLCSQSTEIGEIDEDSQLLKLGKNVIASRNILAEVNEDSKSKPTLLTRSNSLQPIKTVNKFSFLQRNANVLSKFAHFKEANFIQGAQNSDKMVFKVVSPRKMSKKSKSNESSLQISKKPRLDEDSNSIFNILET